MKKIKTLSLFDALKEMTVGETCLAPDECTYAYVKRACTELKKHGFIFTTSKRTGVLTITRLK